MSDAVEYKNCSKSECEVAKSGACAEGHQPLESCRFYGKASERDDSFDDDFQNASEEGDLDSGEGDFIDLPSGETLDMAKVDEFLRWRPIRLITIVGERDSGKTTLICSIYDQFLRGPFASYRFAGSRTLIGLDRRHYYSRADSGLSSPDTPRTSLADGIRFFHFAVIREDEQNARTDLMLSDRAGEKYRQSRNKTDVVSELVEVSKADKLVLLLDGARLANPAERANAFNSVRQTLRAFLDGGALARDTHVQVVTTKIDRIEIQPESEKEEIYRFLGDFKERLFENFKDRVTKLSFFEFAARDPDRKLPLAFGLDQLFTSWVDEIVQPTPTTGIHKFSLQSEFDMLLVRTPMEVVL